MNAPDNDERARERLSSLFRQTQTKREREEEWMNQILESTTAEGKKDPWSLMRAHVAKDWQPRNSINLI